MANFKLKPYKSKMKANGECPIIIEITHNRHVKRLSLGYKCTLKQWNEGKKRFKRGVSNYQTKNMNLRKYELLAEKIIDDFIYKGKKFSLSLFEEKFRNKTTGTSVFEFFDVLIDEYKAKGKAGNRTVYKDTKNALWTYKPDKTLNFVDIDYKFLKGWETSLFKRGCAGGGISVRMRTLRAALNEAIRRSLMDKEAYPFSTTINKNGYSIAHLKSKKNPRALSMEDVEKVKQFEAHKHPKLQEAHSYFMFSYYCRGMNFTDMAHLKVGNVYNGRIRYERQKTGKAFNIAMNQEVKDILNYFAATKKKESEYLFLILSEFHQTPQQKKDRIQKCIGKYNRGLKEIAKLLDIKVNLTSYVARHTFGNVLKKKGVSVSVISELYGHDNVNTTKHYLANFDNSVLDEASELL